VIHISCDALGCSSTFARPSDVLRHKSNIHGPKKQCQHLGFIYASARSDKMKEHWESRVNNFKAPCPGLANISHSKSEAGSNSSRFETRGTGRIKSLHLGWDFEPTKSQIRMLHTLDRDSPIPPLNQSSLQLSILDMRDSTRVPHILRQCIQCLALWRIRCQSQVEAE